jgi:hypothetical protein
MVKVRFEQKREKLYRVFEWGFWVRGLGRLAWHRKVKEEKARKG